MRAHSSAATRAPLTSDSEELERELRVAKSRAVQLPIWVLSVSVRRLSDGGSEPRGWRDCLRSDLPEFYDD